MKGEDHQDIQLNENAAYVPVSAHQENMGSHDSVCNVIYETVLTPNMTPPGVQPVPKSAQT